MSRTLTIEMDMLDDMPQLNRAGHPFDCVLRTPDRRIFAHRDVLSGCSMFKVGLKLTKLKKPSKDNFHFQKAFEEAEHGLIKTIKFPTIKTSQLQTIVQFLYANNLSLKYETLLNDEDFDDIFKLWVYKQGDEAANAVPILSAVKLKPTMSKKPGPKVFVKPRLMPAEQKDTNKVKCPKCGLKLKKDLIDGHVSRMHDKSRRRNSTC
jgi:BTB/POZ domain